MIINGIPNYQKIVEIIVKMETGIPLTEEEEAELSRISEEEIEAIKNALGL